MAYKHYWISRHYALKLIFHKMSAGHVGVGNAIPFVCRTLHISFLQIKKITYKKNLHYHESEAEMFFISIKSPYRTGRTICMCCTFHMRSGLNANAKQRKCLVEYMAQGCQRQPSKRVAEIKAATLDVLSTVLARSTASYCSKFIFLHLLSKKQTED